MTAHVAPQRVTADTPGVPDLLALAMYPDPDRVRAGLQGYALDPDRQVWTWMVDGTAVSAAGLSASGTRAELLHLGTRPHARGQGTARSLLLAVMRELHLTVLTAETDDSAAGFYRRCGFEVTPTPSRWGARYRCALTLPEDGST